jgi:hypothetical protein
MKLYEKDGITFQVYSVLEEARLKKAGYKEVKPGTAKANEPDKLDKTPAEANAQAVENVNKKGGK